MLKQFLDDAENRQVSLLLLTAFFLFFAKLWQGYLGGDEACYALLARQILRTGDWLVLHHPTYPGWENFYEHPPLFMWITALNFKLLGINDFSAKLFPATCGFGTVLVTYWAGKKLVNHEYGYYAAFILLTTEYFIDYTRKARLEVPLTFFIVLSFLFLILALREKRPFWSVMSGMAAALAFLVKGVAVLSAVAVTGLAFLFLSGSTRRAIINAGLFILGWSVILVPWISAQYLFDQGRFFDWYIHKQVAWSAAGRGNNPVNYTPFYFYFKELLVKVMVPWLLISILGIVRLHKLWSLYKNKLRYIAFWIALIMLVAFSLVQFKKTRYIIPTLPFLSLLAAEFIIERNWSAIFTRWITRILMILLILVIVLAAVTPLSFSTTSGRELVSLIPYIRTYSDPGDTLLVAGLDQYTVRQVFTWYLDRPQKICDTRDLFLAGWAEGKYQAGILYDQNNIADSLSGNSPRPLIRSGKYLLFIRDRDKKIILLNQMMK
jgi:4-amino-4-deoxy-L-arabinose transferase-like glycosyltransferase